MKQLVSRDVARIHARERVVHQQSGVEFGNACRLRERAEALAKVVASLREHGPILLLFDQVAGRALSRKNPL